jgi:hypothetical protein
MCVWCISGSRALSAFLVDLGAAMIVASTIVPPATFNPRAMPVHPLEQRPTQIVILQQMAKLADRGVVRHRLALQVDGRRTGASMLSHTALPPPLGPRG